MIDTPLIVESMTAQEWATVDPELHRFLHDPASACLTQSLHDGYNDEDTRRDRYKRKMARRALAAEVRSAAAR